MFGLDPGIGTMPLAGMAAEDHAAHRRHGLPLVVAHKPQSLQIVAAERARKGVNDSEAARLTFRQPRVLYHDYLV